MKLKIYTTPFGHCQYALAVNRKQLRKLTGDKALDFLSLRQGAQTRTGEKNGRPFAIVEMPIVDWDLPEIYALLAHEAVHIWQAVREAMFEESPSSEFEAYSIQAIARDLFFEYEKAMSKSKKT